MSAASFHRCIVYLVNTPSTFFYILNNLAKDTDSRPTYVYSSSSYLIKNYN